MSPEAELEVLRARVNELETDMLDLFVSVGSDYENSVKRFNSQCNVKTEQQQGVHWKATAEAILLSYRTSQERARWSAKRILDREES